MRLGGHRWEFIGRPGPGAAQVEATVLELHPSGGLPLPRFHAAQQQVVTLVEN